MVVSKLLGNRVIQKNKVLRATANPLRGLSTAELNRQAGHVATLNTEKQMGVAKMTTFIMFGSYTHEAIGKISATRTENANAIISDCGGVLKAAYALLGETDIIALVEFPGIEMALKASVELGRHLGITFKTAPAVSMDEFDKLITGK